MTLKKLHRSACLAWRHAGGRGETLTQVTAQILHAAADALQLRQIDVQIHAVDALASSTT